MNSMCAKMLGASKRTPIKTKNFSGPISQKLLELLLLKGWQDQDAQRFLNFEKTHKNMWSPRC